MSSSVIVLSSLVYLAILFMIANWTERRQLLGKSIVANPYIYSLSLAVYCTAWTFYGSVGRAVESGVDFLTVYIGPTLMMPLWWVAFRKIVRICRSQGITNLADFVSARYGKSQRLGVIVTFLCVFGVIPYISIQLKAITTSFGVLSGMPLATKVGIWQDKAFYIAILLALFTIVFGTRKLDVQERHEGLVAVVAFESLVKLLAFLAVGIFVTYGAFDGLGDLATQAAETPSLQKHFTMNTAQPANWFWHCLLSGLAMLFLPRQFQVAVIENTNEKHLQKAFWLFPLYLLIINIFVLPIAFGGVLTFGESVKPDSYVLALPLYFDQKALALVTYLGGLSAAMSMIILECTALTVMLSNNVVMPLLVSRPSWANTIGQGIGKWVMNLRRISILIIIGLAFVYYKYVSDKFSLVSVGMVSFAAVAQLAPAVLGGIFWQGATRRGATWGLMIGSIVWAYTLVLPSVVIASDTLPRTFLTEGPWGIGWLRPEALLGMTTLDGVAHGIFWSLLANALLFLIGSATSSPTTLERNQGYVFVNITEVPSAGESRLADWRGKIPAQDLKALLSAFLGTNRTERLLTLFTKKNALTLEHYADTRLVVYAEKLLSSAVGTASTKMLVAAISEEEVVTRDAVLDIVKHSQELKTLNRELQRKTNDLELLTAELSQVNERLRLSDQRKDDFLSTVTHEIRTPLTSIRAFTEIVHDNPDLSPNERGNFLGTVIRETERLSRLINQVLDLERYESGQYQLQYEYVLTEELIEETIATLSQSAKKKGVSLLFPPPVNGLLVWADRDRLMQVLVNLVSNAIRFVPEKSGVVWMNITKEDGQVVFSVSDNGPGIPRELHALIFDKFFQAQNNRTEVGSGLGLAISKKIIELHHGKFWVESTPGQGASFFFEVPQNQLANSFT